MEEIIKELKEDSFKGDESINNDGYLYLQELKMKREVIKQEMNRIKAIHGINAEWSKLRKEKKRITRERKKLIFKVAGNRLKELGF